MNAEVFLVQTNTSTFRSPGAAGGPRSLAGLLESVHSGNRPVLRVLARTFLCQDVSTFEKGTNHMPTPKLTTEIVAAAIDGYEFQKTRIDTKIAELRAMLSGGPAPPVTLEPKRRKRRKMSGAGRARIAEAQRKRWAKIRGESERLATPEPPKPKRRISKAGMARIIAANRKRWARVRAAKAQQEKAARKAARKKAAGKRAAVKAPPAKAAKKSAPARKTAANRTAPAAAQATTQAAGQ